MGAMPSHIINMGVPQIEQPIFNPNQNINMATTAQNNLNNINSYKNISQSNIIQQRNHDKTNNDKLFDTNVNKMTGIQQNINKNPGNMNLSQNILHNAISPSIISPQNQIGGKIAQVPQIANIQNIQPNNQVHHIIQQHVNFGTQNVGSIPI